MMQPENKRIVRRFVWIGGVVFLVLLLIAAVTVLFSSLKVQQALLNKQPDYSAKELYSKAVDQVNQGSYQTAESYLEQALVKQDDASYRNQLAVVKYRLKKYQESIDQYQKLIASGQDAAFAWNGIGNAYRDWADQDKTHADTYRKNAEDAYKKAITLNTGYVAAYSNLALLYESEGRHSEALSLLDQGIAATASKDLQQVKTTISTP